MVLSAGLGRFESLGVEKPLSEGVSLSETGIVLVLVVNCSTGSPRGEVISDLKFVLGRSVFLAFGASCNLNFSLDKSSLFPREARAGRGDSSDRRGSDCRYGETVTELDPPEPVSVLFRTESMISRED